VESSEIISRGFLVSCCDGAKVFDCIEKSFDEVAFCIKREVAIALHFPVRFGWDNRFDLAHSEALNEVIAVICLVGEERAGLDLSGERFGLVDIVHLTTRQADRQRIAQSINDDVYLCRQAATRAAYGLIGAPFLRAPALC
jgi:hypothetical protein